MRLAFLVPDPDYDEPWQWAFDAEAEALTAAGIAVEPVSWVEARDLSAFDLVLPLVAWGYHLRLPEWLAFLDRAEQQGLRLVNPPALLRWNSDKAYLAELFDKGVPTVPSIEVAALDESSLASAAARFATDALVIKPPVSASASGTHRIRPGARLPDDAVGQRMIVQPMIESIASEGEYSLMLFGGQFSHAVVKRPAVGDFRVQPHFGGMTDLCDPPAGSVELAHKALAAAPASAAYARVDMVRGNGGELEIIELELIEPALFLHLAPDRKAQFAASIRAAAAAA